VFFQQLQVTQSNANSGLLNTGQASITCNKIKQQILNLQNQIAAQQATYKILAMDMWGVEEVERLQAIL
jgi:hypothetical protein